MVLASGLALRPGIQQCPWHCGCLILLKRLSAWLSCCAARPSPQVFPSYIARIHKPWRGVAAPPPWPATKVAEAAKKGAGPGAASPLHRRSPPAAVKREPPRREEPKLKSVCLWLLCAGLRRESPRGRAGHPSGRQPLPGEAFPYPVGTCDRVLSHGLVNLLWPTSGESVLYCSVYYLMYATLKAIRLPFRRNPRSTM